jgi:hypothetical protein
VALLALAPGLAGCMSTSTYGTGEAPEMAIFREVTGGLIGTEKKPPIQYQPRAPLVMPPAAEAAALPPPVESPVVADANWPLDPDQTPKASKYGDPMDDDASDDLSPEEVARLKPLAGMGQTSWQSPYGRDHFNPSLEVATLQQRQTFSAAVNDAKGVGRTGRRYLTDPPEAYREPAATAPSEFEDIDDKSGGWFFGLFGG